jgi:hypothetical protein
MTVTLTVADSPIGRADDGLMGSSTGPRADRPGRRSFTVEYKLAMVADYDRIPAGEKGALLRRGALYSSHIIEWRRARDAGPRSPTRSHATYARSGARPPAESHVPPPGTSCSAPHSRSGSGPA